MKHSAIAAGFAALLAVGTAQAQDVVADKFLRVAKGSAWKPVATVPIAFPTHHPQGMVKIGERFYMSSVEIIERTQRYPRAARRPRPHRRQGRGHLFEIDCTESCCAR